MLVDYICEGCGTAQSRIFQTGKPQDPGSCKQCKGGPLKKQAGTPAVLVKERLDNGMMPKAVERPARAEEFFRSRSQLQPNTGLGDPYIPKKVVE